MSRIIVKNIGKNTSEGQLKDLFSQRGEVTDVKLMKNLSKTVPRNFAFIGFRTELQAQDAIKYFNNSFIGLSKIAVELARKLNDPELNAEKQKHALTGKAKLKQVKESLQNKKEKPTKEHENDNSMAKKPPQPLGKNKKEFLEVVKKTTTMQSASDAMMISRTGPTQPMETEQVKPQESDDSDDDSAMDLEELVKNNEKNNNQTKNSTVVKPTAGLSDLDYLRSKVTRDWSDDEDEDNDQDSEEEDPRKGETGPPPPAKPEKPSKTHVSFDHKKDHGQEPKPHDAHGNEDNEPVPHLDEDNENSEQQRHPEKEENEEDGETDEARLFIKNIPYSCTEDELKSLAAKYGTISEVHIPLDKEQPPSSSSTDPPSTRVHRGNKGYGFITFLFPSEATKAMDALNGASFQGRLLFITKAAKLKEKEIQVIHNSKNPRLSAFQQQKEEERRKNMMKKENWNASFIRSDAVMENIKDKYGVEQSTLLNTSDLKSGDVAVRLAIAETQIIQENKDYLQDHGINLDVLESVNSERKSQQRSSTTILIKNLPPNTEVDELESMFSK
jgi:multiple RNA-binding domain-containing protein 1